MKSKTNIKASATKQPFDPEIERLLYIGTVLRTLIKRSKPLLDSKEFSRSADAIAKLSPEFDRELELNLLRTYEQSCAPLR